MTTKKQTKKKNNTGTGVSPISGVAPPKKHQFGQPDGNPRHNGVWTKEDTPRYKMEQIIKLSEAELLALTLDNEAPVFEKEIAKLLLDRTIESDKKWRVLDGMINQVYGYPKQTVDNNNIEIIPILPKPKTKKI